MEVALNNSLLIGIIIELNGSGNRYGYIEDKIHEKLLSCNFEPYFYSPFERKLVKTKSFGSNNTLYLKDIEFVNNRIQSAKKIKILNQEF